MFVDRDGKRFVKFYVHPHSEKLFRKYLPDAKWTSGLQAAATSSYRSLLTWDPAYPRRRPFGVKVSLDAHIGQVWRVLKKDQIETSASMSAWLNSIDREAWGKRGALFMDEPVNAYLKGPNLGFSFREYPVPPMGRHFVPLFSYYSKRGKKEPLIVEALRKSGEDTRTWVDRNIIEPQTRHYTRMLIEEGVAGVPHEQNVIIEVGNEGQPTGRFMYRDLGGFSVDAKMRAAAHKDLSFIPKEVDLDSVLLKGSGLQGARDYLINSNFYAMRKSLEKDFPEITEKWVEGRFLEHIRANAPELKIKEGAKIRELIAGFRQRLKKAECPQIFSAWNNSGALQ
ncbi:MAG: IucA/IucC family protein [Bdellovibrionota bacterium]